jgi:hypothetical protein
MSLSPALPDQSGLPPGATITPLAAQSGPPPGATVTPLAGAAPMPAKPNPVGDGLTANPNGEGVYPMVDSAGQTVQIPFSNVQHAAAMGHRFQTKDKEAQYARDFAADPVSEDAVDKYLDTLPWYDPQRIGWDAMNAVGTGALKTVTGLDKAPQGHGWQGKVEQDMQLAAATPTKGIGGVGGELGENIGEWISLEGLVGMLGKTGEAMGMTERLKAATNLAKIIADHPVVGKLLKIGSGAVKQGSIGAGQTYAKTGDAGAAAESGVATAVAGPLLEGAAGKMAGRAAEAAEAAKPKPTVDAQLNDILDSISPNKVSKQQTGTAVRGAVDKMNDVATQEANTAYNPLKEPLGLPPDATRAQIEAASKEAAQSKTGTVLDANGKPVVTPGDNGKASAALKAADTAYGQSRQMVTRKLVEKIAKSDRPELAHQFIAKASLDDLAAVLPKLDEGTRSAVARNVMQDVVNAGGDPANFNATAAIKAYRALDKDGTKTSLLFGDRAPEIRNNLQAIADATATPAKKVAFTKALRAVAHSMASTGMVGGAVSEVLGAGYAPGVVAGAAFTGATYLPDVLRAVAANPRIGRSLTFAIEAGARPEVYGPMIARMVQADHESAERDRQAQAETATQ